MGWRNRILGMEEVDPESLLANPQNWRRHPAAQREALRGSLNTVGWVDTVLVNKRTGYVIDGHERIEEALSRHEKKVPVIYVDLEPEEERIVLASLDPITAMAERDQEALNELVADLHVDDQGLQALLDSLSGDAPGDDPTPPTNMGDPTEVTCPACGHTFMLAVTLHAKGGPKSSGLYGVPVEGEE
jgi:hypothetical protein